MTSYAHQLSMLDAADEPRLGPLAGRLRRHALTRGAWVDHLPGWVQGSDGVLQTLLHDVQWRAERREMYDREVDVPRLLRWYDGDEPLPHPVLTAARGALSRHYAAELGEPFVTAGMCLYRDGRDSVAWHGDTTGRSSRHDTMVAIVSFGAPRPLLLRPRAGLAPTSWKAAPTPPARGPAASTRGQSHYEGGTSRRFLLGHGDLIVMGGSCQRTWEHAIPKTAHAVGPRISIQFRPPGVR
jgi:alkylated DNA repair dioxygenase AlkB